MNLIKINEKTVSVYACVRWKNKMKIQQRKQMTTYTIYQLTRFLKETNTNFQS